MVSYILVLIVKSNSIYIVVILIWYRKLYHTRMAIPYEYTRTVCTIRVRYEIRVRYTTMLPFWLLYSFPTGPWLHIKGSKTKSGEEVESTSLIL